MSVKAKDLPFVARHILDAGRLDSFWTVYKWARDYKGHVYKAARDGVPIELLLKEYEVIGILRFPHNLFLNEGINALWTLFCGGAETAFSNANAYIGVGDSNTPADATQTGLQATTNKLYKSMDATYPTYGSGQKATFRSTFAAADAQFPWNEITVANGNSDSAKNLNRKVQSIGTKGNVPWTVTLEPSIV